MDVLIVDPAVLSDVAYQERLARQFGGDGAITVRFATGILQAAWLAYQRIPDVVIVDRSNLFTGLTRLMSSLWRRNPDVAAFHLVGGSLVTAASERPQDDSASAPSWLRELTAEWLMARAGMERSECRP